MSSRDLGTLFRIDRGKWKVAEEVDPPGVVWAAVATNDGWRLTIGKGLNDDRFVYRYKTGEGFRQLFACPDFTGSYLSFDGEHLYLSQWYKGDIHELDDGGNISRTINVGAEICGHTFVDQMLYVLRGKENKDVEGKAEEWRIARLDPAEETLKWKTSRPSPSHRARSLLMGKSSGRIIAPQTKPSRSRCQVRWLELGNELTRGGMFEESPAVTNRIGAGVVTASRAL